MEEQTKLTPEILYRDATVEVVRNDKDSETVTGIRLAFSSETPVDRFDFSTGERFHEVLDHSPENVDLARAADGLALLIDHDGPQVGLVRNIEIGADKVARGDVTFGNHPDAAWVRQDMIDGIRTKVSVGYRLGNEVGERAEGGDTRRFQWTPLEVSTVSVPADMSVGVGRAEVAPAKPSGPKGAEEITVSEKVETPVVREIVDDGAAKELEAMKGRQDDLAGLAEANGMTDKLAGWLSGGKDVRAIQDDIIKTLTERAEKTTPAGNVDLTEKEHKSYSITKAIRAAMDGNWKGAGFELEVSNAAASAMKRTTDSNRLFLPMNLRTAVVGNVAGTDSIGGYGVQTDVGALIDLLRNQMLVRELGATILSGLQGDILFPRQLAANTLAWEGENPSTAHANTAATVNSVTLSPKTAMGGSAYSRQLLAQNSFDVEQFILRDLTSITAIGIDLAAIKGTGSNNQPTGILVDSSVTTAAIGANGGAATFVTFVELETQQAENNADFGRLVYLTTPGVRGEMKTTLKNTAVSGYIWEGTQINGYDAFVTNQVPTNLTKGTSTTVCHGAIFGNFAELLIGEWGGAIEVIVDPYSAKKQGMVEIETIVMVDVAVRHGPSFTVNKDITVT